MSTRVSARTNRREKDTGPLLGALLRLAHQELIARVERSLAETPFADFRMAYGAVTQQLFDHPEGKRLTDLAKYARVTKPSMSALVDSLVASGYVERVSDPTDGRAQLVRLAKRGRQLAPQLRQMIRDVEADWGRRIGKDDVETLRRLLKKINATR